MQAPGPEEAQVGKGKGVPPFTTTGQACWPSRGLPSPAIAMGGSGVHLGAGSQSAWGSKASLAPLVLVS